MRGQFIVFEGPDGSGKTTQMKLCAEYLEAQGFPVVMDKEPTNDAIGALVRRVLSGELDYSTETLALLFAADRREHIRKVEALLYESKTVLCDRYVYSNIAYQGLELPAERVIEVDKANIERLLPDAVVYIDLPTETCMERIAKNRETVEIFETQERIEKVRENYEEAFDLLPPGELFRIDGAGTLEEVKQDICSRVEEYLKGMRPVAHFGIAEAGAGDMRNQLARFFAKPMRTKDRLAIITAMADTKDTNTTPFNLASSVYILQELYGVPLGYDWDMSNSGIISKEFFADVDVAEAPLGLLRCDWVPSETNPNVTFPCIRQTPRGTSDIDGDVTVERYRRIINAMKIEFAGVSSTMLFLYTKLLYAASIKEKNCVDEEVYQEVVEASPSHDPKDIRTAYEHLIKIQFCWQLFAGNKTE